jgi:hypothetical protein
MMRREAAMLAVIRTRPLEAARSLVPAVFDRNQPLATRLAALDWLTRAAPEVQGGAFPEYIRISVLGQRHGFCNLLYLKICSIL